MGQSASEERREVERAREQLAGTVEALVYRMNAPRRAKDRVLGLFRRGKRGAST
jgi:Protein of unknown function (DUF3618)